MALCLIAAGKTIVLAGSLFTLSWTHSVERTRWEEDWRITPAGLEILEARIRGSGAGMEPPESSVLRDGWWVYRPALSAQRQVTLAQSAATGEGWTLCAQGSCVAFGSRAADPAVIRPCGAQDQ